MYRSWIEFAWLLGFLLGGVFLGIFCYSQITIERCQKANNVYECRISATPVYRE